MTNKAIVIAAYLFGVGALIHLARLFYPFEIIIAGIIIPIWFSSILFIFAGALSAWLFRAMRG
jgi:hypothetical protein